MKLVITKIVTHRFVRLLLVAIAVGLCLWTIKVSASYGVSRLLARSALALQNLTAAQTAARLTPADPQAHRANAALLNQFDEPADSVVALEQAIALRPSDYSLWLALGLLRDKLGDSAGAVAALDQAIVLAPYYAHPRWQRGNILLRAGQYEAAFTDLNQAAQSNPELIPNIIDLAWGVSRGDPQLTEQLVELRTDKSRVIFARFLASRGRPVEAMQQFRIAGTVDENERRELLRHLLNKRAFAEAYQVWAEAGGVASTKNQSASIYDGGFEGPLSTTETGFGWRVSDSRSLALSVDPNKPHSGAKSLQIEFAGESPNSPLVSQLIVVKPSTRYRINFAGRSREIVTGGRPIAVVTDAGENGGDLGKSPPLDKGTTDWRSFSVEFATTPATHAVLVIVTREQCPAFPCPIFGSIGLDSFSIEQMK